MHNDRPEQPFTVSRMGSVKHGQPVRSGGRIDELRILTFNTKDTETPRVPLEESLPAAEEPAQCHELVQK
jgi:hypothetical protein